MKPTIKSMQEALDYERGKINTLEIQLADVKKNRSDQLHVISLALRGLGEILRISQHNWEGNIGSGAVPSFAQINAKVADQRSFIDRYEASESRASDEVRYLRDLLRVVLRDPRIERGSDPTASRDRESCDTVCDESMNRRYQR